MSILVVGALHLDVVVHGPHMPRPDETVAGTSVNYVPGGKGGNQAIAAARMGAEVAFAGRVGQDAFGETLTKALTDAGIDTSMLQHDPGPSGMSVAIVDEKGDYGAMIVSAANLQIDASVVEIPAACSHVVLQNEVPEAVNLGVAQKARAAGVPVWLNAAPARALSDELLSKIDLVIVNRLEAAFYEASLGQCEVLTTLGADGVTFRNHKFAPISVPVVSTHGAGDMFVGALAACCDRGRGMSDAIDFAQAAAALHVSSTLEGRARITRETVEGLATKG